MVNQWIGEWKEEEDYANYPKEKWCDYDHMAVWIRESGYQVKTNMENLITMIFAHFDSYNEDCEEYGEYFTIEGCKQYVEDSGGLKEFDYYC